MVDHVALPGSLETAHDVSITYRYMAPVGHTLEMCCDPDYWKHNMRECNQQRIGGRHAWNKIEIISVDGTWEAMLRIMSIDMNNSRVTTRLLSQWPAAAQPLAVLEDAPTPDGYRIEFIEGNGWRALEPGGTTIIEKKTSRDDVVRRVQEHANRARPKGGR